MTYDYDAWVGTAEAAHAARVSQDLIRQWAYRGRLKEAGRDKRGWPLYRVGDVLKLEAETHAPEVANGSGSM